MQSGILSSQAVNAYKRWMERIPLVYREAERSCLAAKYHHYFMMCGKRLQYNELGGV